MTGQRRIDPVYKVYKKMRSHLVGVLPYALILVLLSAQTILLLHDHDGDLSYHADCSICFKKNQNTDFIVANENIAFTEGFQAKANSPCKELVSFHPVYSRSRSPPAV